MQTIWITLLLISGVLLLAEARRDKTDVQSSGAPSGGVSGSAELSCPPCEMIHCSVRKAKRLQRCKGGLAKGVCGCCLVCAKLEGQRCGGALNFHGTCDQGLYCRTEGEEIEGMCASKNKGPRSLAMVSGPVHPGTKSGLAQQELAQQDEAANSLWEKGYCRPTCTPEFCMDNPNHICSANGVTRNTVEPCQGDCQHTSCQACEFIQPSGCKKCKQDDWRCLREYGKCVRQETCTRKKYPCKSIPSNMYESPGEFRCQVPACAGP